MGDELMKYAMVAIAIAVLAFSAFSVFSYTAQPAAGQARAIALQQSQADFLALQQKQAASGIPGSTSAGLTGAAAAPANSECGDLNDDSNVQHLSHHPDRYAECLKQVDAAVLKRATGKTLGQLIG